MRFWTFILTALLVSSSSFAKSKESKEPLKKVLAKYHDAKAVTAQLQKTLEMTSLLEQETKTANGVLYFAKGRFRLAMNDAEKTTIVHDGKTLWVATKMPEDFGGKWQVMRSSTPGLKKSNSLLAVLMGDSHVVDGMELLGVNSSRGIQTFRLDAKKIKGLDVETVEIAIRSEKQVLERVKYADAIGNKTTYVFKSNDLNSDIAKDKFRYEPPADAEITNF